MGRANAAVPPQEKLALRKKRRKEREALGDKVRAAVSGWGSEQGRCPAVPRPVQASRRGFSGVV